MSIRAVLFDLDGTLLDTLVDVASAANAALSEAGFAELPIREYRRLLGGGVHNLFHQALPEGADTPETIDRCIATFRKVYGTHWNDSTRPYAGIPELVSELWQRGYRLAVLSNKPHEFTRTCIAAHFGSGQLAGAGSLPDSSAAADPSGALQKLVASLGEPIGPFAFVVGARPGVPVKPDPSGALQITAALQIPPEEFLYVGDTPIDVETARSAGMRPVAALWGFRSRDELEAAGADTMIETPGELMRLVGEEVKE